MSDFDNKLSEALMRVAELDGIYPENEEISGGNMLSKKQKVRCVIYGILWLVLWLFSMTWIKATFNALLYEPHISKFIMFVMILFCMWKGIPGLTRNIMRLQLNKTISELEKMINDRKKEDSKRL